MREDPMIDPEDRRSALDDNVVALPDLMNGRLADLLAAAGGPAQDHELRGELAARTAYRAAVESWPSPRRRLRMRRGPAAVAATTMATMLIATTGLAAASVLPGSAGRAVDGLLGSVGVDVAPSSTPAAPAAPGSVGSDAVSAPALHPAGTVHVGCTTGGSAASGAAVGTVGSSSCALTVPLPVRSHSTTSSVASVTPRSTHATPTTPVVLHTGSGSTGTPTTPPTTLPGGGTSRGGNQGAGGGGCKGGSTGSTTTTTTSTDPATTTTTSTDPAATTTTDPTTTGAGCGKGGHHHGASGGQTSQSNGGTGSSAP
jgi:hypothetical protein